MRKICTFTLLFMACLNAQAAQWKQIQPTVYQLEPSAGGAVKLLAGISKGSVSFSLADATKRACQRAEDENSISAAGPYKINGKNVKFMAFCVRGNRIISPATPEGKAFFAKAVTGGKTTIEFDWGMTMTYESEGFDSVKKAMLDTESAI